MSRPETPCPVRETPPGLTLKRKQGWFGSFRSIVHQSALTAKAAVDGLRGVSDDASSSSTKESRASDRSNDSLQPGSNNLNAVDGSPKRTHGWHRILSSRSTVSSLRSHLPLRSSLSKRGSLPSLFKSDSHTASLRGPEAFVDDSPPPSKLPSRLSEECKQPEEQMSPYEVPLPTSPIAMPDPAPMLSLDLGPIALKLDFSDAVEMDKEVKALQDPANFTTGRPVSPVLPWQEELEAIQQLRETSPSPMSKIVEDQMVHGTIHLQVTELDVKQTDDSVPSPCKSVLPSTGRNDFSSESVSRPVSPLEPDDEVIVPYHGPPSPTRKVQLTLRPKQGLFRSGSIQEKYFPHVTVGHASFVETHCNDSIDSKDSTQDSSPSHTPSMGDRLMFDLQRSERNARYNTLYASSELQLANFDYAGPGSTPSSPGREDTSTPDCKQQTAGRSPGTASVIRMVEDQILGWGR